MLGEPRRSPPPRGAAQRRRAPRCATRSSGTAQVLSYRARARNAPSCAWDCDCPETQPRRGRPREPAGGWRCEAPRSVTPRFLFRVVAPIASQRPPEQREPAGASCAAPPRSPGSRGSADGVSSDTFSPPGHVNPSRRSDAQGHPTMALHASYVTVHALLLTVCGPSVSARQLADLLGEWPRGAGVVFVRRPGANVEFCATHRVRRCIDGVSGSRLCADDRSTGSRLEA